jgi:hypothetical protein
MDKYNDQRLSPRVGMVRGMFCALYPFALLCLHYIRFRGDYIWELGGNLGFMK